MTNSPLAGAAVRPLASARSDQTARSIIETAQDLLGHLAAGRRIEIPAIRTAMQSAFGASDASGAWDWKAAYEAVEIAQLLFLRRYGPAIHAKTADPFERLKLIERIARLAPTHTRRSEDMVQYQQLSTPLGLAWVAGFAAQFQPGELVLEPSAGTGLLAIHAELADAGLVLNEVANTRLALLRHLFGVASVTAHDAAQIHDRLEPSLMPSCIVMNPPFSAALGVEARVADTAFRHIASALARLADGGRLVAITGSRCAPDHAAWRGSFIRLQESARVVFTAPIAGRIYASHGTMFETRLTVIDKRPADDPCSFLPSHAMATDLPSLLRMLLDSPILWKALRPRSTWSCRHPTSAGPSRSSG
ncbi:MAG: hypothetical protein J0M19_14965 [Sphingomonadales bacterium]|nr:hypothetical protein [Sphingomonadales bacterium]